MKKTPQVIVKRGIDGLGLFANESIKKGQFIIEYIGEVISNDEADQRGGRYLFEINSKRTIDGTTRKNKARYINHSCRPNSEPVWHKKGMWIKSIKTIQPGEEITYNYGKEYFDNIIKPKGCRCLYHKKLNEKKDSNSRR